MPPIAHMPSGSSPHRARLRRGEPRRNADRHDAPYRDRRARCVRGLRALHVRRSAPRCRRRDHRIHGRVRSAASRGRGDDASTPPLLAQSGWRHRRITIPSVAARTLSKNPPCFISAPLNPKGDRHAGLRPSVIFGLHQEGAAAAFCRRQAPAAVSASAGS